MDITVYYRAKPIVETIEKCKEIKKQIEANKNPLNISFGGYNVSNLDFSFKEVVAAMVAEIDKRIQYYENELLQIK